MPRRSPRRRRRRCGSCSDSFRAARSASAFPRKRFVKQCTSRFSARPDYLAGGTEVTARTTVAQHAGDVRPGTLRAIERDLEAVFRKGWLKGR
jgi:hypothetical protein